MPDSFFASQKSRKRKRSESSAQNGRQNVKSRAAKPVSNGVKRPRKAVDEELSDQTSDGGGIDDLDLRADRDDGDGSSGDEDDAETPAEKRLRLAKLYLESVKNDLAEGDYDAAEIDKEIVNARLKQDVLEHSGKLHLFIADSYDFSLTTRPTLRTRGHRLSVTAATASESCRYLFTAGKEGSIMRWDLRNGKLLNTLYKCRPPKGKGKETDTNLLKGHTDELLALAVSSDGRYLVSAGKDRRLGVWDAEKAEWIHGFSGPLCHKDTISALAFRKGTHQLYTGSFDRTLKVFDLSPNVMGYVETLYGHQDRIVSIDALRSETCVSVGAQDKTTRFWKIVDETQLVFRGGGRSRVREVLEGGLRADEEEQEENSRGAKSDPGQKDLSKQFVEGSLECIAMIDEHTFITGGDSGSICLWTTQKKKPVFTQPLAHGMDEVHSPAAGLIQKPRWITALGCLRYSDLFASGSWDGSTRLWKVEVNLKSFSLIGTIPAPGVVNSLQLLATPKEFSTAIQWSPVTSDDLKKNEQKGATPVLLVIGMGQEHRLGRWIKIGKESKGMNGAIVTLLQPR
ncbi:WD40-repeat-containing domain protein [Amanita muscaria]